MVQISPSLLSADFTNLERDIKALEASGADMLHLDVMDGQFVPNITFGFNQIKQMRKHSKLPFDVHLMIERPERYVQDFANAGSDILTVHAESTKHLHRTVQLIKSFGVKAGVSLNPATPLCFIEEIIDELDLVLIMSVNPGFGGQKFISSSIDKIKRVKSIIGDRDIFLEVDGGINESTAKEVVEVGANLLVAGSYVFSGDLKERIDSLRV